MVFTEINLCRPGYFYISIWMVGCIPDAFMFFPPTFHRGYTIESALLSYLIVTCLRVMCLF